MNLILDSILSNTVVIRTFMFLEYIRKLYVQNIKKIQEQTTIRRLSCQMETENKKLNYKKKNVLIPSQ